MKNYLVTLMLLVCSCTVNGQVAVKSRQLIGTVWKIVEPYDEDVESRWTFSSKEITTTLHSPRFKGNVPSVRCTFYLSPKYQLQFNHSKSGTVTSGCYLMTYNQRNNGFDSWYIRSFDKNKGLMTLTTRRKVPKGAIGGNGEAVLILQRISPR